MEKHPNSFCVFILSHGRPDNVITWQTLRNNGYNGPLYIVIDNEDKTWKEYVSNFGADNVIFFDKRKTALEFDEFDNFDNRSTIVYARNECFTIARKLGCEWFLELDDDYTTFKFRMNEKYQHPKTCPHIRKVLGETIYAMLDFYKSISAVSIAFSQGGDWCGGAKNFGKISGRKCMNSFFCSTTRPFKFVGRINEDVNIYTWFQSLGNLFLTIPLVQLDQKSTQKNKSGMSDIYLGQGTYIKSFYTILCSPSSSKIAMMGETNRRIHHKIDWKCAVPMLVSDKYRKTTKTKQKPKFQIPSLRLSVKEINSSVEMPI